MLIVKSQIEVATETSDAIRRVWCINTQPMTEEDIDDMYMSTCPDDEN